MKYQRKEKGGDGSDRMMKDGGWGLRDMLLMADGRNALGKGTFVGSAHSAETIKRKACERSS